MADEKPIPATQLELLSEILKELRAMNKRPELPLGQIELKETRKSFDGKQIFKSPDLSRPVR